MENKIPEISVIVPVYNVEKYLPQCLDSILASTFKDIEVIIVDDCGPDNSRAICDEYAAKDKRIKVISNPHNMGLSAARNNGLEHARGKYISFIDSDDYIDVTMLEKLHTAMEREKVDIVGCNAWNISDDGKKDVIYYMGIKSDTKTSLRELKNKIYTGAFHVWRFLYKKEILENIRFDIIPFEDTAFMLKVYPKTKNIYYLAEPLYFYCNHDNTLSVKRHKRNFDTLKIKDIVVNSFNENPNSEFIKNGFWKWYCNNLAHFYDLLPKELQGAFVAEVQKILPYAYYQQFLNRLENRLLKYYLFDFIPILTVKYRRGKKYVRLFGKIPLYEVKYSLAKN
jgi:glycosyltransferase involved in cell wall biosynthesis